YRRGGSSLRGMDCSGFVRTAYQELFGIELPHGTAFQYPLPIFNKVSLKDLRAGDLIFFSPRGKTKRINHVGIYLSDGRFIHSARSEGVTVSSLSERYWKSRVCAARRISNWDKTPEQGVDHFSKELTRKWEPQSITTLQFYELQPSLLSLFHHGYLPYGSLTERGFGSEVNLQLALLNLPWTLKLTAFREYYFLLNHADIYNPTPFQDENNPSYSYLDSRYAQGLRVTSDFQPWEYLRVSPSLTYLDSDLKIYTPSLPSFYF
ncbi:MAG: C40 family peptidase, partial [Pseudomonadota bacterium]